MSSQILESHYLKQRCVDIRVIGLIEFYMNFLSLQVEILLSTILSGIILRHHLRAKRTLARL